MRPRWSGSVSRSEGGLSALGAESGRPSGASAGRRSPRSSSRAAWSSAPSAAGSSAAADRASRATTQAALSIYPCPDSGPALATVGSGQKFLVTGKNADASWVRIYYPLPGRTEAWVTSGPLQIDGSLDAHPGRAVLAGRGRRGRAVRAERVSLTAIEDNSPSPGADRPASRPSRRPTAARRSPGSRPARARSPAVRSATARTTARSVTVSVRVDGCRADRQRRPVVPPAGRCRASRPSRWRGAAARDTWQATLRHRRGRHHRPRHLRFFVSATDRDPKPRSARLPATGALDHVADCANTGPTLASLRASPGTVSTNLGACAEQAARRRRSPSTATDVDGVAGVTLHYQLPGRRLVPRRRDDQERGSVAGHGDADRPATRTPTARRRTPSRRDDDLGKTAKSATRSFTVNRCNFPAAFVSVNCDTSRSCASSVSAISLSVTGDRPGRPRRRRAPSVVYTYTPKGGSEDARRKRISSARNQGASATSTTTPTQVDHRLGLQPAAR